jgi:hypothetical protein
MSTQPKSISFGGRLARKTECVIEPTWGNTTPVEIKKPRPTTLFLNVNCGWGHSDFELAPVQDIYYCPGSGTYETTAGIITSWFSIDLQRHDSFFYSFGTQSIWMAIKQEEVSKPIPLDAIIDRAIERFLSGIYRLGSTGDLEGATDRIFDVIDRLLSASLYEVCDKILKQVSVDRLPTALLRSFLTITAAAKDRLEERPAFFKRVETEMIGKRGEDTARRLLSRLG